MKNRVLQHEKHFSFNPLISKLEGFSSGGPAQVFLSSAEGSSKDLGKGLALE